MAKFRVLIADDLAQNNREMFTRLLDDPAEFEWQAPESWRQFGDSLNERFDLALVDVNLEAWGHTLGEALQKIGDRYPVILITRRQSEPRTYEEINQALASAKRVPFVGTFMLNDLGGVEWKAHAEAMRSHMRFVIARSRCQGLLELGPSDPLRILHISDPQYGDPASEDLSYLVEKEIPRFLRDDMSVQVHLIAITGDITYSGLPCEFALAEEKLRGLVAAFLPERDDWPERVLLVPGNHDVNLKLAAADQITYRFRTRSVEVEAATDGQHRHYALQGFRDFAWRLTGSTQWRDSNDLCWINDAFRHLGVRFFLLSSVASLDCAYPQRSEIPPTAMADLIAGPRDRNLFSVALSHHGPPDGATQGIDNWEQVARLFQTCGIQMLLHGHGHERKADIQSLTATAGRAAQGRLEDHELMRVMAPTTHLSACRRPGNEYRGFNLITLNRHAGSVEWIQVESFTLGSDGPHKAPGSPWRCRKP